MMKKCVVGFVMCLGLLGANAWAQTTPVLDTGDPNERVCNPKSYTDLDNGIVKDNVTGLEWVQGGNLMVSRDPEFDTDGTAGDGAVTWQHALDYIALLNADEYLGYSDWRLPTIEEISTIVDAGTFHPAIDPVFNAGLFFYWSSTACVYNPGTAWGVHFFNGYVSIDIKGNNAFVRAVRGGPYVSADTFVVNGDGTVTDTDSGLMWQQCNYGQAWIGTECTGSEDTRTWDQAFASVQELNDTHYLGYDDWRLPTRNELQSIVDYTRFRSATQFPLTQSSLYRSSTVAAYPEHSAWGVHFYGGDVYVNPGNMDIAYYVRAVRGGSCRSNGDWCIENSDCGEGGSFCNKEANDCVECVEQSHCSVGYVCVDGSCQIIDNPPVITSGPFLGAGPWPVLPTSSESAFELDANYDVLWTFSDDFGSCSGACTHVAEYQAVGDSSWTALPVTVNVAKGRARVTLPVESLPNATYAFRFAITDCASQTTQSGTYYFKVVRFDPPPVITAGPFLAAGPWPLMPTSAESAFELDANYSVLWTFSDYLVSCYGPCTHVAEYQIVGGSSWTALPVWVNVAKGWAIVTLPVKGLKNATYAFRFAVIDCAGQTTPSGTYYFTVNNIDDVRQYQGRVSASTDDGMERQSNGQISLCNNLSTLTMADLDLGTDDDTYPNPNSACSRQTMLSAMRFTNVGVPPEIDGVPVAVSKAYIEFTARKNNGDTNFKNAALNLKITAQAADNPSTLWTSVYNISSRTDTAASVTWSVPGTAWTADWTYQTSDLTPIVQELINRPGWQAGNAMLFKIDWIDGNGGRVAHSFDSNFNLAPRLVIEFDAAGEPL